MNKLFDLIGRNLDKVCHVTVCIIITIVLSAIFLHTTKDITLVASAACGLIGAVIIGVLKEVIDFIRSEQFSISDIIADVFGGVMGFLMTLIIL